MSPRSAHDDVPDGQVMISGPDRAGTVLVEIGRGRAPKRFNLYHTEQNLVVEAVVGTWPAKLVSELVGKLMADPTVARLVLGGLTHQQLFDIFSADPDTGRDAARAVLESQRASVTG